MAGRVVITTSAGSFPGLVEEIRALPAPVEERPLMSFAPPPDWGPVDRALAELGRFEAVAVTSPRAARALAERAGQVTGGPPVWTAGPGTGTALGRRLGPVRTPDPALVGSLGAAAALSRAMLEAGVRGPVLFPCGELRRDELPARLRAAGVDVTEVVCYRSLLAGETEARNAAERATVLVVASPSVADLLARACPPDGRPALLAVGPTTAAAARAAGWPPDAVARRPAVEALVTGVRYLLTTR